MSISRSRTARTLLCLLAGGGVLLLPGGCSTDRRLARIDARARALIKAAHQRELGADAPEPLGIEAPEPFLRPAGEDVLHLDLRQALALGARHSRDYQTSREELYQSALALVSAAHDWDWLPANSLKAMLTHDAAQSDTTATGDASAGFSRRLNAGGRLAGSLAFHSLRYLSGEHEVSLGTLASLTLTQPLLAGYGEDVAREPLTQAERNLVYALRRHVRARKSLLIDIADRYYGVLSALDSLEIARRNYTNLKESRERSEAMAESGRVPLFQVDQARQRELAAQSSLVQREEAYQSRTDDLKTILGLPLDVPIELERSELERLSSAELPRPPMEFDEALAEAFRNRLDWATARDRLADAERRTRIARDAVRGKLSLVASAQAPSRTDSRLRVPETDRGTYSIGLEGELPLDRTDELIAYREALIAEARQKRTVDQERDRIVADLRNIWRRLRSSEQDYQIQRLSLDLARKRVESTELLFQAGRVDIRELLDARDSLIVSENAVTVALVEHRMNWLRLQYQLEQLPTEPDTLWSPALAGGAAAKDASP